MFFEPKQEVKIKILEYVATTKTVGAFTLDDVKCVSGIKSNDTALKRLSEINEDLYDAGLSELCLLDLVNFISKNCTISIVEQLKRYYFERSGVFQLFDAYLTENYVSQSVIADQLDMTIGDINKCRAILKERLAKYSINVVNNKIEGSESIIRYIASHVYAHYFLKDSPWYEAQYATGESITAKVFFGFIDSISDIKRHWLSTYACVTSVRVANDHIASRDDFVLSRDDLFEKDADCFVIIQQLHKQFVDSIPTFARIKLSPDDIENELSLLLHNVALSGIEYTFPMSEVAHPSLSEKLRKLENIVEDTFNKRAQQPMSEATKDKLKCDLIPLFCMVIVGQNFIRATPNDQAFSIEDFKTFPVGFYIGLKSLYRVLPELLEEPSYENIHLWSSIIGKDFITAIIAHIDPDKLKPPLYVKMNFSHGFQGSSITSMLLKHFVGINFVQTEDLTKADILFTNVHCNAEDKMPKLVYFYNSFPTRDDLEYVRKEIVAYSAEKYFEQLKAQLRTKGCDTESTLRV
jgi:hypothetical protein